MPEKARVAKNEVYVEFTAARDRFCLLRDTTVMELVAGPFDTKQKAKDWASTNGYVVNDYVDGKLQPRP